MAQSNLLLYVITGHKAQKRLMLCVYPGLMSRTWLRLYVITGHKIKKKLILRAYPGLMSRTWLSSVMPRDLMDGKYSTYTGTVHGVWLTTAHQTCRSNFWVHHIWKLAFSPKMTGTLEVICSTGWRRMPAGFRVNHFPSSAESYKTAPVLTSIYSFNLS